MARDVSFQCLGLYHSDLLECFARHQEALLEKQFDEAAAILARFKKALLRHIRDEEEVLLPLYEARVGKLEGGRPELFHADHLKLEDLLPELEERLAELRARPADPNRRILALLDAERTYKNVLEHHDQRERNIFFPALDRVTPPAERRALLARCRPRMRD